MDKINVVFWFMWRLIRTLLCATAAILFIWVLCSYFDIIAHNLEKFPQYASWNIFEILF